MKQTFTTKLLKSPDSEATWIELPFDIEKVWGSKRVKVKAWINGAEYRGSAVRRGGYYLLGVPKSFRDAAAIKANDTIEVIMDRDDEPRIVALPDDLADAIKAAGLQDEWNSLSFTRQKENARAVAETKGAALRRQKVEKIVLMLQVMAVRANLLA